MSRIETILVAFGNYAWGPWLVALLLGGGIFFLLYSRLLPFQYFKHALDILRGEYDSSDAAGDISHFRALSSALAGTIGLGNIAGVAVAIHTGGPGAIFWMWVGAFVGIATKFFTCTLAVLYRGPDSRGHLQGGPMYAIIHGLGPRWKPLAMFFSFCALFGPLPLLQTNQLIEALRDVVAIPNGWIAPDDRWQFNFICGLIVSVIVAVVVIGGIQRIGAVTARIVPSMVVLYVGTAVWILLANLNEIPALFALIVRDAFTGEAVAGGAVGAVIMTGIRRSALSNEAGIGSEALAHGAAKTDEPVREGLVAMLGPLIDTIIVCSATAMIILSSDVWRNSDANGVTLTAQAFEASLPGAGPYILVLCVFFFAISTMFSFSYYGSKALGFLIGAERQHLYNYFYVATIMGGALISLDGIISFADGAYALMAIPTMTSSLLLAPRVMAAARDYFARFEAGAFAKR